MTRSVDVTNLLVAAESDEEAMNRLLPLIYDELQAIARRERRGEWKNQTLNTTALVHEAYMKLVDPGRVSWENRGHFFGAAARAMRQILIDYARTRSRAKRGGGRFNLSLEDAPTLFAPDRDDELLALDEALTRLEKLDPRQSRVVECRYFGGLTIEETAEVLNLSPATIKREWRTARLWLYNEMLENP